MSSPTALSTIPSPTNRLSPCTPLHPHHTTLSCISFRYSCDSITHDDLTPIYHQLTAILKSPPTTLPLPLLTATLPLISKQLRLDTQHLIHNHPELIKGLIKHFNRLSTELTAPANPPALNTTLHCTMLSILSILTQILHQSPNTYDLPYNRAFIQNLFMVNLELLENSTKRKDIVRVMSVIFENLSKRIGVLRELGLVGRFKQILLESWRGIEERLTFARFYRSLCRVCAVLPLTGKEIVRYRVQEEMKKWREEKEGEEEKKEMEVERGEKVEECRKDLGEEIQVDPNLDTVGKLKQT